MDSWPSTASPTPQSNPNHHHQRIKLNVGGHLFETTPSTLQSAGPDSLLAALSSTYNNDNPVFIDRDPLFFSALLSLLRTHRLPSTALRRFSIHHLLQESLFYGLHSSLLSSLSPPPLSPFDASLVSPLSPPSNAVVSAFVADNSSLLVAHSGFISSYDSTLFRSSTIRTHLDDISSICRGWRDTAAIGSDFVAGLHFYSTSTGRHVGSSHWSDPADPRIHKAWVAAIEGSSAGDDSLFASFECRHGENAVLVVDKSTLRVVSEIGRQSGNAAKSSAVRKLTWTPSVGLLVGSSVTCGAFGYFGYVRAWDPRSPGEAVWETSEPGGSGRSSRFGDAMADVDVDPEGLILAKVCSRSGDLGVVDMRKLGPDPDPWVYLEDPNPSMSSPGVTGQSVVVHCYGGHVVVGREGGLESWSRVAEDVAAGGEERNWGMYRRSYVDKFEDLERGIIRKIQGAGNRLFVLRENVEGIEVWETSASSSVGKIL